MSEDADHTPGRSGVGDDLDLLEALHGDEGAALAERRSPAPGRRRRCLSVKGRCCRRDPGVAVHVLRGAPGSSETTYGVVNVGEAVARCRRVVQVLRGLASVVGNDVRRGES
ncbi:hypothetical protein [Nannocystis pusilla]|uniref:hypothetical protein n=1 Tax=Nannocystis pusilla TaxID=889268 RepID=UPI003DA5B050